MFVFPTAHTQRASSARSPITTSSMGPSIAATRSPCSVLRIGSPERVGRGFQGKGEGAVSWDAEPVEDGRWVRLRQRNAQVRAALGHLQYVLAERLVRDTAVDTLQVFRHNATTVVDGPLPRLILGGTLG